MNKKQLFENFIISNLDNAYRFAYSYTKNKQDAEDVVNDSVIKAMSSIHKLRNPDYMKSWFYKIIANTALNNLKRNSRIVPLDDGDDSQNTQFVEDTYSVEFDSIIECLEEKYRSIILLRFSENMSLSEISEILDINENTVKTRLYTAIKILKDDMLKANESYKREDLQYERT